MSDAELIYNACLRAERKYEPGPPRTFIVTPQEAQRAAVFAAIKAIREEIGRGISETYPS